MLKKIMGMFKKKPTYQFNPIEQIGTWQLEMNRPFGFIVRSMTVPMHEYHFHFQSTGWVSGVVRHKKHDTQKAFNANADQVGTPVLVDKESCKKYARFAELQKKGKTLTHDEAKELLALTGVIKE